MVPFDIVGEIADIDSAVLLRVVPNTAHHLLSSLLAVFKTLVWLPVTLTRSSCRNALAGHGTARTTLSRAAGAASGRE